MDSSELKKLIGLLDDRIDDLEEALEPLTSQPVADTAGKLPLLDKAQLYILVTYALESMIFCTSKPRPFFATTRLILDQPTLDFTVLMPKIIPFFKN